MPKAITYLSGRAQFSIYDNTFTFYPSRALFAHLMEQKFSNSIKSRMEDIDFDYFVHNHDETHNLYHQDNLKKGGVHYHMKFKQTIDSETLKQILEKLKEFKIISNESIERFIEIFNKANELPEDFSVSQENKEQTINQSPYNPGFFSAPQELLPLQNNQQISNFKI